MRKLFSILLILPVFLLAACGSQKAMTEEEQAAQYNMTVEAYRQEKQAAARMNMSWDEHVKMLKMEGKLK
jgi:uncharacterized protein YcfL